MSDVVQIEVIRSLPGIILALVVVGLVIWVGHPLREKVLPRVSGLKVMWLEVTLIQQDVTKAEQIAIGPGGAENHTKWHGFNPTEQEQLVKRAGRIAPVLRGASVLWVDDQPQFNNAERNILGRFGISIDIATTSEQALWFVARTDNTSGYNLIISDIKRPGEQDETGKRSDQAGLAFLDELRAQCFRNPVIYYVGEMRLGAPPGAFGICAQPGDLFRLTFDALERTRARCISISSPERGPAS